MSLLAELSTRGMELTRGRWVGLDAWRRPLVRWDGGPTEPVAAWAAIGALPAGMEPPAGGMPAIILPGSRTGEPPVLMALLVENVLAPATPARLELAGTDGVVIRCGQGRLEIDREGAVTIRGRSILSRASGTHRIKGGSVQIN